MNNQPKYTRNYSYYDYSSYSSSYRTSSYHKTNNEKIDANRVYIIIVVIIIIVIMLIPTITIIYVISKKLNRNENNRNASNNLNSTCNRNISYRRNYSYEIDDDLPPYTLEENQSSIPEVSIDIPNALIRNSNNEELPPRYADAIRESMINYNNRVLSS